MSEALAALARRVRSDPFFLASALDEYARSEELGWEDLSRLLHCSEEQLVALSLCRRPRPDGAGFWEDTTRIAGRFEISADLLADMVRRADTLAAWRRGGRDGHGRLQAARDRDAGGDEPGGDPP